MKARILIAITAVAVAMLPALAQSKPDKAKADKAKAGAAKAGAAKPDSAKPDSAKPDSAKPDGAQPDSAKSGSAKAPAPPPATGPGEMWRVTLVIKMPGVAVAPPPMTYEYCKTARDAAPYNARDPQSSGCELSEQKFDAKQGYWKIKCSREGMEMQGEGRITYSGDTFKGELHFKAVSEAESFEMTQEMSGQKLGPCKK